MAATIFEVLENKLEESVDVLTRAMQAGKCEDYANYQYLCGQIRGLKVAQASINDLKRQMQEDNDDD